MPPSNARPSMPSRRTVASATTTAVAPRSSDASPFNQPLRLILIGTPPQSLGRNCFSFASEHRLNRSVEAEIGRERDLDAEMLGPAHRHRVTVRCGCVIAGDIGGRSSWTDGVSDGGACNGAGDVAGAARGSRGAANRRQPGPLTSCAHVDLVLAEG